MQKYIFITLSFILGFLALSANDLRKLAFERYPFGIIFSKAAPIDLENINYDTDFCYFYFSPSLDQLCGLKRMDLCTGTVNAKMHFPDYKSYFDADIKVMREFTNNRVLAFCEPWAPLGLDSWVYTRKTAFQSKNAMYMLGCFDLVDDITLGIAKFKKIQHNAFVHLISALQIPDQWFIDAFDALPNGMAIVDDEGNLLYVNRQGEAVQLFTPEFIQTINDNFLLRGFMKEELLVAAAWQTNVTLSDGLSYDIGTYGIQEEGKACQVIVLRPIMQSVANPYWEARLFNIQEKQQVR